MGVDGWPWACCVCLHTGDCVQGVLRWLLLPSPFRVASAFLSLHTNSCSTCARGARVPQAEGCVPPHPQPVSVRCIYGQQLWLEVTGPRCLHSTWKVSSCPVVDYGPLRKQGSLFAFPIKGIWGIFEKGKQVGISVPMLWTIDSTWRFLKAPEHKHHLPRLFFSWQLFAMPSWGGWDEIRNLLQVGKVQTHVSHLDERCWQCFAKALLKLQVMRLLNRTLVVKYLCGIGNDCFRS